MRTESFHLRSEFSIFAIFISAFVFNNAIVGPFFKFENENDEYEVRVIEMANYTWILYFSGCNDSNKIGLMPAYSSPDENKVRSRIQR